MIENYDIKETLGKGAFGKVFRAIEKNTGIEYALKRIEANGNERRVQREVDALMQLRHPHIISLYGSFKNEDYIYLVTDYIQGKNVEQLNGTK